MSRNNNKKVVYRAKDEFPVRFGFQYNQEAINYRTQIPALPEKPKHKPDDKVRDKKIADIEGKIVKLKEAKQKKKDEIKKLKSENDVEYEQIKGNILLGKKCIVVLEYDIDQLNLEIGRKSGLVKKWQNKIGDSVDQIKQIKFKNRPVKKLNKKFEEMTNFELDEQRKNIEHIMSTKSLTKKEEAELNSKLNKITRIKLESNRPVGEQQFSEVDAQTIQYLEGEIAKTKEKITKVKSQRFELFQEREELEYKIEDIKEDIIDFIEKLKQIAEIDDSDVQV